MCTKLPCTPNNIPQWQYTEEKADLQKTKVNTMKITKVRADGNKLHTGSECRPIGLAV